MKATDLVCKKVCGGKRALWHAKHPTIEGIVGAGNTADNAIKDFQKQFRKGSWFRAALKACANG